MPYLIDGHNLIAHLPDLSLSDPHDETRLVERLRSLMARQGRRCTVVFDAGLPGGPSRELSTPSVQVVFAHGGTTADKIIMERLRAASDSNTWIVVSADQEIIEAAQRRRMRVVSPVDFARGVSLFAVPDEKTPDPRLTPGEIEEWLDLFGGEPDDDPNDR